MLFHPYPYPGDTLALYTYPMLNLDEYGQPWPLIAPTSLHSIGANQDHARALYGLGAGFDQLHRVVDSHGGRYRAEELRECVHAVHQAIMERKSPHRAVARDLRKDQGIRHDKKLVDAIVDACARLREPVETVYVPADLGLAELQWGLVHTQLIIDTLAHPIFQHDITDGDIDEKTHLLLRDLWKDFDELIAVYRSLPSKARKASDQTVQANNAAIAETAQRLIAAAKRLHVDLVEQIHALETSRSSSRTPKAEDAAHHEVLEDYSRRTRGQLARIGQQYSADSHSA